MGGDLRRKGRVIVGGRCLGDVGEGSTGRGRESGCFMRPLTFTSPAFQSAVSIKEGCSSYVFPIHQRPRDTRPHTDGQLDMMEREKVDIRQWRERKWKYWEMREEENEKKGSEKWNVTENSRENGDGENGRRWVPCKQLKQHFVPEYALFKVGRCLYTRAGILWLCIINKMHATCRTIFCKKQWSQTSVNIKEPRENRWGLYSQWQSVRGVCGSGGCPALFRL